MRPALPAVAAILLAFAAALHRQPPPGASPPANRGGVNVGYLNCNAAGGVGFVFGSSRTLNCLFTRTDGVGERYEGTIRRFGVDIGFTRESTIVWMVFAPGSIAPGALAGEYAGASAQGTVGVGVGAKRACRRQQQSDCPAAGQRRRKRRAERGGRRGGGLAQESAVTISACWRALRS